MARTVPTAGAWGGKQPLLYGTTGTRRIEVSLDGPDLTIRKTVATGPLPIERYDKGNPARALMESGVASHLNNNGPVSAPQLLGAIRHAMDADDRDRTLFDNTARESIRVVSRTPHRRE